MNHPSPHTISDVRAQIDAIDGELAALIAKRCALSAAVGAAKRRAGDHAFGWRPAREVEILRQVIGAQPSLDPQLAFCVWRALISANLAAQGDLKILCLEQTQDVARAAFSVGTQLHLLDDEHKLLEEVLADDHAIGVLPWPDQSKWWVAVMEPAFAQLHVCAATPLVGESPEAFLVAARAPEPAGDDISLVVGPAGAMDGGVIASHDGLSLVAVGEFIGVGDALPKDCRLIGSFARA
jgi:chorismate mutase